MKKSIIINIISWLGISLLLLFLFRTATCIPLVFISNNFVCSGFNQDYALQLFSHPGGNFRIHRFFSYSIFHPSAYRTADYDLSVSLHRHRCAEHLAKAVSQPGNAIGLSDAGHPSIIGRYGFQSSSGRYSCLRISSVDTQFIHPHPFPLLFGFHSWPSPHGCCSTLQVRHSKRSYSVLFSMNSTLNHLSNGTPSSYFLWVFFPACWWYQTGLGGEARIVFSPDAYFNPRLALQPIIYYAWGALLLIFILACLCGKFKGFKKKWMTYTSPILQIILAGWFLHNETKAYNSPNIVLSKTSSIITPEPNNGTNSFLLPFVPIKIAMHACFQNLALAQKGYFGPTKHYRSNK